MDGWQIGLGIAAIMTVWFLPIGMIRTIAYLTSDTDHTPGMRNLALATLAAGVVSAGAMIVLAAVVVRS